MEKKILLVVTRISLVKQALVNIYRWEREGEGGKQFRKDWFFAASFSRDLSCKRSTLNPLKLSGSFKINICIVDYSSVSSKMYFAGNLELCLTEVLSTIQNIGLKKLTSHFKKQVACWIWVPA